MRILLAISGSIAFYKAFEFISLCKKDGHNIKVLLSDAALKFVSPLAFEALCDGVLTSLNESWKKDEILSNLNKNYDLKNDDFQANKNLKNNFQVNLNKNCDLKRGDFSTKINDKNHIEFSRDCDVIVFAPASVNSINKLAHGIADTLFMQTLIAAGTRNHGFGVSYLPIIIAPAANPQMLNHFSTQNSLEILRKNGAIIVPPSVKTLACGEVGQGALADVSVILAHAKRAFNITKQAFKKYGEISHEILKFIFFEQEEKKFQKKAPFWLDKKVVITGGGTREMIDEVRFIGNLSSGKMAKALADAFWQQGAKVVLLSSVEFASTPYEVRNFHTSTELEILLSEYQNYDFLIMAAAVGDFKAQKIHAGKLKKSDFKDGLNLKLDLNKDLLKSVKFRGKKLGFKLEFDAKNALKNAKNTMKEKNLDAICLNIISLENPAFDSDKNEILIISKNQTQNLGLNCKTALARDIVGFCEAL